MNNKKLRTLISVVLSFVMIFSCFGIVASAADVKVIKQPNRTTFYQGIDWSYNKSGTISVIGGTFDLSGIVLSYNSKEVSYTVGKWPNMYSKSESDQWKVGKNTMKVFCDDFPSSVYANVSINLVAVESISIINPPLKTILVQDKDWKLSGLGDVEFTSLDLTGLRLSVKYKDGTTKLISYPDNQLIGWAVSPSADFIEPGKAELYATFCDKRAPFTVIFATKNAQLSGDINRDFKINSLDALMVLQFSVGSISLDSSRQVQADVSKDKKINSLDALMILQYSVGQLPSL